MRGVRAESSPVDGGRSRPGDSRHRVRMRSHRPTVPPPGPSTGARAPVRARAPVVRPAVPPVLLARDLEPDELRARVRDGSLQRVLRGVYAAPPTATDRWSIALHLLLCRVAVVHAVRRGDHWFSHRTAAALWGCSLDIVPAAVDVTAPLARRSTAGSSRADVVEHWTADPDRPAEVCRLGVPVTPLARTLVDCASSLPGPSGLVVVDSGLRAGADPDELRRLAAESAGRRGIRRARTVIGRGDDRAESAGESLVRWHLLEAGVPAPEPQSPSRHGWAGAGWTSGGGTRGWPSSSTAGSSTATTGARRPPRCSRRSAGRTRWTRRGGGCCASPGRTWGTRRRWRSVCDELYEPPRGTRRDRWSEPRSVSRHTDLGERHRSRRTRRAGREGAGGTDGRERERAPTPPGESGPARAWPGVSRRRCRCRCCPRCRPSGWGPRTGSG